ncbi:hypothetical protein PIB30_075701 [Stylosanthes scabra]|uniref:Uncharacterized protein n=1 Tax=Stylosanthes scabra TaxID=79078 RepID=A0ABU6WQU7_9FABA|nr:hypothetical protein [Stylosanthes scabra]
MVMKATKRKYQRYDDKIEKAIKKFPAVYLPNIGWPEEQDSPGAMQKMRIRVGGAGSEEPQPSRSRSRAFSSQPVMTISGRQGCSFGRSSATSKKINAPDSTRPDRRWVGRDLGRARLGSVAGDGTKEEARTAKLIGEAC